MATQQTAANAVALLSQTVLALQLVSAQTPTAVIALPANCSYLRISFPNIAATALLGLASTLAANVGISEDGGTTWIWDQVAFTWSGGSAVKSGDDGIPRIGRSLPASSAGLKVKSLITASGFLTDAKIDIF